MSDDVRSGSGAMSSDSSEQTGFKLGGNGDAGGVEGVAKRRVDIADGDAEIVLRSLPNAFLDSYLALNVASSSSSGVVSVGKKSAKAVTRTSTSQTETRGPAKSAKAGLSHRHVITYERALVERRKVDRKLRALAREIKAFLDGPHADPVRSGVRRCTRCKTFTDSNWNYCPDDGAPTEEMV